jgi:hypothetical protein
MVTLTVAALTNQTIATGGKLWVKVTTNKKDLPTAAAYYYSGSDPTNVHAQPDPGGNNGEYYYLICTFVTVGSAVEISGQGHLGGPIVHRPGRNNRNLDLHLMPGYIDTDGRWVSYGSDVRILSWRQGDWVGFDAGAADNLETEYSIRIVDPPPP